MHVCVVRCVMVLCVAGVGVMVRCVVMVMMEGDDYCSGCSNCSDAPCMR